MAPKRKAAASPKAAETATEQYNEEETVATTPVVSEQPVSTQEEAVASAVAVEPATPETAAPVEEEAPYTPVSVTGSTTEIYSQLQSILAADSGKVNFYIPQVLELVHAAESADTPILMRVRFVEFIGQHVSQVRDNATLRKVVTSLVKIVGGEDNTPQLLTAAVQAFAGLGPVSVVDKNWEYLAREGADVLMQVMIDRDAFPEAVRHAAAKSLDALTNSAFRSVLAKLLHWLSLDREEDNEAQIAEERRMALTRLFRLVHNRGPVKHWTEETESYAEPLLQRVLNTVDAREFAQLARFCSQLPGNKAKGNLPLLEWYIAAHKLTDERTLEAVAILGRHIGASVEFDLTPALEAAGLLSKDIQVSSDGSVDVAKVILLACRVATPEAAEKLYPYVFQQVSSLLADMRHTLTTANVVAVEALLFAAVVIARKKSTEVLQKLNDEAFYVTAVAAAKAATEVYNEVVFAVKKAATHQEATAVEADAVASLANIKHILEALAAKRLPLGGLHESWRNGQNPIPKPKQTRDATRSAMPPPPGSHAAEVASHKRSRSQASRPDAKRQRTDRHGGGNQHRHPGNSNNGNNRSQSRHSRGPRRDNRH